MDNKEKQVLISIISSVLIMGLYSFYVYDKYIAGNPEILNDFKFWGKAFLILIPVTIIAHIIIHIIFAIINKILTNEDIETISDERDKLIDLKALQISHWIFVAGFLLSMIALVIGLPPYTMFFTLIAAGFISSLVSEFAKLYYYRKGF